MLTPDVGGGFGPRARPTPKRRSSRRPRSGWAGRSSGWRAGARTSRPGTRPRAVAPRAHRVPARRGHRGHRRPLPRRRRRVPGAGQRAHPQHGEPPARPLSRGALSLGGHQRRHEQDAEHGVPRGRPPRGGLRDGAPDGPGRAAARPRSRRRAPEEPRSPFGDAVPPGPHLQGRRADDLRSRRLSGRLRARAGARRLRGLAPAPGRQTKRGTRGSGWASRATPRAPGSARSRARRSASIPPARSTSSSAWPRRARATPRRWPRCAPRSSAPTSTT